MRFGCEGEICELSYASPVNTVYLGSFRNMMPTPKERQVKTTDLTIGMYVSNLDRPWMESPFAFQGFTIRSQSDIDLLTRHCSYVYVDVEQGVCPSTITGCKIIPTTSKNESKTKSLDEITHHHAVSEAPPTEDEHIAALVAYYKLEKIFTQIASDVKMGEKLNIPELINSIKPMIVSVSKNKDAFIQLLMLDARHSNLTRKAITSSVLATAIGMRIGVKKRDLMLLALGGFLYDVGKLTLPPELLGEQREFTAAEFKVMQSHVNEGVNILKQAYGTNPLLVAMAQHHHERFDGSGYPTGMIGTDIPLSARIIAIVDCFGAMTAHRPHAPAMSPYHAALKLYEWRNVDFDPRLIEQLIQVVGVYPIGSPVELTNGETAVVIAHNKAKRLRPVVAKMLNADQEPYEKPEIVDLSKTEKHEDGSQLGIKNALQGDRFSLNLSGLAKEIFRM